MMLDNFKTFATLGLQHITDPKGFDHILFIITICAIYSWQNWKELLKLVTAFTIGHSVTLALAATKVLVPNYTLIELLIPVTILFSSIHNLYFKLNTNKFWLKYIIITCFGFIHGLGFSNFFTAMMGDTQSIVQPLFAFNIGLEIGQLFIVLFFMGIYFGVEKLLKIQKRDWTIFVSGAGFGLSLVMILERM